MRENMGLFRGKRIDNGEWVDGYLFCDKDGDVCITREEEAHTPEYWVDPSTVGECTGLKDKNGKLIFEGDICRNTRTGEIVSVKWHGTMAGYVWSKRKGNGHIFDFGELFRACDKYEVIGNIHDNGELIHEK